MNADKRGATTQQARLAWDRLRNVLDLDLSGPTDAAAGGQARITVSVTNSGSGHNFPPGLPEGRIAWVAIPAFDLPPGSELPIHDSFWTRTPIAVGRLTGMAMIDPSSPRYRWKAA